MIEQENSYIFEKRMNILIDEKLREIECLLNLAKNNKPKRLKKKKPQSHGQPAAHDPCKTLLYKYIWGDDSGSFPCSLKNYSGSFHGGVVYYKQKELSLMDEILSVNILPESLHRRFRSNRVRVHEENGVVILTPIQESNNDATWPALNRLRAKISDGRLSTESYVAQKQIDKELEG